jgi:hypothetical protein
LQRSVPPTLDVPIAQERATTCCDRTIGGRYQSEYRPESRSTIPHCAYTSQHQICKYTSRSRGERRERYRVGEGGGIGQRERDREVGRGHEKVVDLRLVRSEGLCAKRFDVSRRHIDAHHLESSSLQNQREAQPKPSNSCKPNQTKQTKPNQTKPNQTKPNQIKPIQIASHRIQSINHQ